MLKIIVSFLFFWRVSWISFSFLRKQFDFSQQSEDGCLKKKAVRGWGSPSNLDFPYKSWELPKRLIGSSLII